MRSLWRIFRRSAVWEWRMVKRSPLERVTLLWLPAIAIGSIWFIFSISQVRDLPVGILDKDNSALSRKLIRMIDASPNVAVNVRHRDAQEMQGDLKTTRVYATLIIPRDFSRHIRQLQPSPVTLVVNAQYGTHSGVIQSGVGDAVRTFSAGIELRMRKKMGLQSEQALNALVPIKANGKMAFNLSLNYQQFLAGTIIPALLHVLA
ncbi:MAG: beta-carotene 15,15'-monooxygenase, partial [Proteobacteria bacterium]